MGEQFILAETRTDVAGISRFLKHVGAPDWRTDAISDGEELAEIAGRLCYKSFTLGLNPNVTRVREGNRDYIGNIIRQRHGSVLEHATTSIAYMDVSRIFTHELVRHRPGAAYSQESQRYVRLDTFDVYIPELTPVFEQLAAEGHLNIAPGEAQGIFLNSVEHVKSEVVRELAGLAESLGLDWDKMQFHLKKQLTSAFRRMIPSGVTTNILVTANHRLWRHMIANRTSSGAEEEIAKVLGETAELLNERYPAFYQDMIAILPSEENGCPWVQYTFDNEKI